MITVGHDDVALTSTGNPLTGFLDRIDEPFLTESLKFDNIVLFCRKISGSWVTRDVSPLWSGQTEIEKSIARDYGVSSGTETEFTFSNIPLTQLTANYSSGTTLTVEPRITVFGGTAIGFELAANDWISISDWDTTEYRRVSSVVKNADGLITTINITEALDSNYMLKDTKIRFVFAIETSKNRLDNEDFYEGLIRVKSGFPDLNEYIVSFQGQVVGSTIAEDDGIMLTCRDRLQEAIEFELDGRVEFDDRGVASPPTAASTNDGNGEATDIEYLPGKLPNVIITEAVTATYQSDSVDHLGESFDTSGWDVVGTVSGTISSLDTLPNEIATDRWLSSGEVGERRWNIDCLDDCGWSFSIKEGDALFENNDTFRFFTNASGTIVVVKGEGYTTPLDTSGLTSLNPSFIIEYLFKDLLAWTTPNPETDTEGVVMNAANLTTVRGLSQDFRTELRGHFEEGTRAIEVVDDALRIAGGWAFTNERNEIGLFYYSPYAVDDLTTFNLSADADNDARIRNVFAIQSEPFQIASIRNRVVFEYDLSDTRKEIEKEDSTSITDRGKRSVIVRGEDYNEYRLTSRFGTRKRIVENASIRVLRRTKDALRVFTLTAHPNALRSEIGDIPFLYSRTMQFQGRVLIIGLRKNMMTGLVEITCEEATHLNGKFAKVYDISVPKATIWDATGFIGSLGEERFAMANDPTLKLDVIGNNNAAYDQRLGTPDQFGNYVEDPFIVW